MGWHNGKPSRHELQCAPLSTASRSRVEGSFPFTSVVVCSLRILVDDRATIVARNDERHTAPVNPDGHTNRKLQFNWI